MSRPTMVSWLLLLAFCALAPAAGCGRSYYRRQADDEVYSVISEKANHPHWNLPFAGIGVDPSSRMYDPYNPDRPPMPIDDPVSHTYMHWVDGKRGYPRWHANGHTVYNDNPAWMAYLPTDANGVLTLDGANAVRLALLHSTNYQQQLETLYLSAMDVSSERFRFDVQYFGGYGVDYLSAGPQAPGSFGAARSELALSTRGVQARRFFTTGAEAVVGFANTLMWQFSGPNTHSANTLIDFSLVQPLLRQAGRARIMETLTLSERTMLANVRQMERYRRGFYLDIMTGTGNQPGPQRRGGFFGAAGLGGFTGVGGGGFGGVGGQTFGGFGGGGGFGAGGAGAGTAGGFLGLLQTQQTIRNQEANIAALQSSLAQLEAFREAGRIDYFQVEQVRQQVFQNLSQLLTSKRIYQDSLDNFKQDLGLPPYIPVELDDPILEPFRMIDSEIVPVQNRVTELQREVGNLIIELLPTAEPMAWSPQLQRRLRDLREYVEEMAEARQEILDKNIPRAQADIDGLKQSIPNRLESARRLKRMAQRARSRIALPGEERLIGDVDATLFDVSELDRLPETLQFSTDEVARRLRSAIVELDQITTDLNEIEQRGEQLEPEALMRELQDKVFDFLPAQLTGLANNILELSLIQARARAESVALVPVDIDSVDALEIARVFRHDWMNARASLVDAWRLIEFNANLLESDLDIVFEGDIRNVGDNPFALNNNTGTLRAGIRFDAPITRLQERNIYRQALIEYQQARRSYYSLEDGISSQLRSILRQLELNKVNFELRRVALRVAVAQVQSARIQLEEPPRLAELGSAASSTFGPTTAQNLLTALAALRGAQDDFLSVWVNYEVQRGLLDLSLGTMELDNEGLWLDPGAIGPEFNYPNLDDLHGLCPWIWTKQGLAPRPPEPEDVPPGEQYDYEQPGEVRFEAAERMATPSNSESRVAESGRRIANRSPAAVEAAPLPQTPEASESAQRVATAPAPSRRNPLPRLESFQRAVQESQTTPQIPTQEPKGGKASLRSASWLLNPSEYGLFGVRMPGDVEPVAGLSSVLAASHEEPIAGEIAEPEWAASWEALGQFPPRRAPQSTEMQSPYLR